MPVEEIQKFQRQSSHMDIMTLTLAIHCAPLLKGRKIANILTVNAEDYKGLDVLLSGTGISYRFLKTRRDKSVLMLYRADRLLGYLSTREIGEFMAGEGYSFHDLDSMLDRLSARMTLFSNGETAFPHEIGLFLGYPLSDVLGFIGDKDGHGCQLIGYWKVYDHADSKRRLFYHYDKLRELAVNEVLSGKSIREIAV